MPTTTQPSTDQQFKSTDQLYETRKVARQIMKENPRGTVESWIATCLSEYDDELLILEQRRFAWHTIFNRLHAISFVAEERINAKKEAKIKRTKIVQEAKIKLWEMRIIGLSKPLHSCTFLELGEAVPLNNKFLSRLAASGPPGARIEQEYPNEASLQEFFRSNQ